MKNFVACVEALACVCFVSFCDQTNQHLRQRLAMVIWRSTAGFVNFLLTPPTGFGPTEHLRAFLLVRLVGPWHDSIVLQTVRL